jgi:hypothetical protein
MDLVTTNPLAVLSFISAPAVLTNASCVLLFGAGNRYARAVDRMHELAKVVDGLTERDSEESRLRVTQLEASENRALFIVRALTCFYASAAAFVASTLIGLLGAIAQSRAASSGSGFLLLAALVIGSLGVGSMILGAMLLVAETRASFKVLRQEKAVITHRLQRRSNLSVAEPN